MNFLHPVISVIVDERRDGPRWLYDDDDDDVISPSAFLFLTLESEFI